MWKGLFNINIPILLGYLTVTYFTGKLFGATAGFLALGIMFFWKVFWEIRGYKMKALMQLFGLLLCIVQSGLLAWVVWGPLRSYLFGLVPASMQVSLNWQF